MSELKCLLAERKIVKLNLAARTLIFGKGYRGKFRR